MFPNRAPEDNSRGTLASECEVKLIGKGNSCGLAFGLGEMVN